MCDNPWIVRSWGYTDFSPKYSVYISCGPNPNKNIYKHFGKVVDGMKQHDIVMLSFHFFFEATIMCSSVLDLWGTYTTIKVDGDK